MTIRPTLALMLLIGAGLALPAQAKEEGAPDEKVKLPPRMVEACKGFKSGDACTIIGPTGIETGGHCQKHQTTRELFCQPEGMPENVILGEEVPEDPR
ncbi:hypothetical protein [Ferrimonas balearica]|uniref:hypothetical protein n=1 Tax=Ferrimonas balearica TaxID=44012 RepID=UPI001C9A1E4F|nr:hypothetical protein [Ferrimonas balearica]MBY5992485.1 hypothetical protein [Ferrimonas balearica]